ncbi:MAG: hypothetical protein K2W96_17260 [Gemmataceae bacterium]|nr:hypothetical protein [Gemmataceae bacterium]
MNDSNDFKQALARDLDQLAATAQQLAGQVRATGDRSAPALLARLMIDADKARAKLARHMKTLARD